MCFLKKRRKEEKILLFSPPFDFRCNREETLLRDEEWKQRKWVKCKWTPPPTHRHRIGSTGNIWSFHMKTLVPLPAQKGTQGSAEAFHDSFMPSWNSSKVFGMNSTGVNTRLLHALSCIIQQVNWSRVSKLKKLISNTAVWNNWCEEW